MSYKKFQGAYLTIGEIVDNKSGDKLARRSTGSFTEEAVVVLS